MGGLMYYTGAIEDAILVTIAESPTIQFIYGTVIYDNTQ